MRVPTYQKSQQMQGAAGPRMQFGNQAAMGLEEMGGTVINIIESRMKQRQQETDTADVLNAYTLLTDSTREEMGKALELQGVNARGAGKSFDEWYNKKESEITKDYLFNDAQRLKFKGLSNTHRRERLDSISRHEAREHQVYKKQSQEALYSNTIQELILNPFDDKATEGIVNRYHAALIDLFPGQNTEAHADEAEAAFRTNQLMAMVDQDPIRAEPYLESFKDEIGIQNYTQLKAKITAKKDEGVTNAAYVNLKGMFPDDPDKAIDFLTDQKNFDQLKIDVGQQQGLIRVFEGEKARKEERRKKLKDEAKESALNLVAASLRKDDTKGALDVLNRTDALNDQEKFELETKITKPRTNQTDPIIYEKLMKDITSGKIRFDSEIMQYTGHGITENNEQFLKQLLKDTQADPDQKFYLGLAEDVFDNTFGKGKDATDFSLYKPEFMTELHKQVTGQNPEGKKLKGQQILDWVKTYVGTTKDIVDPWFWQEGGTEGKISKTPFGEKVRSEKGKSSGKQPDQPPGRQPATKTFKIGDKGHAIATNFEDIPDADKQEIAAYLKKLKKPQTEENFIKVYQYGQTVKKVYQQTKGAAKQQPTSDFIIKETGEKVKR